EVGLSMEQSDKDHPANLALKATPLVAHPALVRVEQMSRDRSDPPIAIEALLETVKVIGCPKQLKLPRPHKPSKGRISEPRAGPALHRIIQTTRQQILPDSDVPIMAINTLVHTDLLQLANQRKVVCSRILIHRRHVGPFV